MKRFNWDSWDTKDEHRRDISCDIITGTPSPTGESDNDINGETPSPTSDPEPVIKAPPRIETFFIHSCFDNEIFIEEGYLYVD